MSEHKFKAGDKVTWKDAEGYLRVGTVQKYDDLHHDYIVQTDKRIKFYQEEDDLSPAGHLIDEVEAAEEFRKRLNEGFFDKANEELSGEEIVKMIKAVSDVKLEPIGLTREMLGIETGAVVAGRDKDRHEAYQRGHKLGEIDTLNKLLDFIEEMRDDRP